MLRKAIPLRVPVYSTPRFFRRLSLSGRILFVFLPIMTVVLGTVLVSSRSTVETVVASTSARSSRIQAHAIGFALAQILRETRNQLLVLAAGSMNKMDMLQRMQFRTKLRDINYREVAFTGATPEDRYLLLNEGGEIISIPPETAEKLPTSPFRAAGRRQRPNEVSISMPTEIVYPTMNSSDSSGIQNQITLHVIRFSTPVFHEDGSFWGILTLSLDISTLRNTISTFASSNADEEKNSGRLRTIYIDRDGWMIFQGEQEKGSDKPLRLDDVRAGFRGEFGRPGFSTAFRPSPDYYKYWAMMNEIEHGRLGQDTTWEGDSWKNDTPPFETVSYAPVIYQDSAEGNPEIVGTVVVLDSSFTDTETGARMTGLYLAVFCAILALFALLLYWAVCSLTTPLKHLAQEIKDESKRSLVSKLEHEDEPEEVSRLRNSVNSLIERLRFLEQDRDKSDTLSLARFQLDKVDFLPKNFTPPEDGIIGISDEIKMLKQDIAQASRVMEDVLVVGETGTGKELVSRAIHQQSSRRDGPFITINCGALDEGLLMDTLFGHVKGAYTEARQPRKGAFLAAEGGTLMLDEIGTASSRVQQSLLRALSDRCIHPLGSDEFIKFNTRVIAATNANLREESRNGKFREDLYFRLAVITIHTSPLRQHKQDIPYMVEAFLREGIASMGTNKPLPDFSRGAMSQIMHYHWPGNVRELRNCIMRTLAFCDDAIILPEHLQLGAVKTKALTPSAASVNIFCENVPWADGDVNDSGASGLWETPTSPSDGATSPSQKEQSEQALPQKDGNSAPEQDPSTRSKQHSPEGKTGKTQSPSAADTNAVLNPRIQAILPDLLLRETITRQEYQELAGGQISMRTAQYDLQELSKAGYLQKQGRGPALRYIVLYSGKDAASPQ